MVRDEAERKELLARGLPHAERIARKLSARYGGLIDVADMLQAARELVVAGIGGYDPRRGSLEAFVWNLTFFGLRKQIAAAAQDRRRTREMCLGDFLREVRTEVDVMEDTQEQASARLEALRHGAAAAWLVGAVIDCANRNAEEELDWSRASEKLRNAMSELTPATRRLLTRRYFDGAAHGEIAASEGMGKSTVRRKLANALRLLGVRVAGRAAEVEVTDDADESE